jgi:hypothetical protein
MTENDLLLICNVLGIPDKSEPVSQEVHDKNLAYIAGKERDDGSQILVPGLQRR